MALAHEDLHARELEATGSSNRTFGFVFSAMFALVCLFPLREGHSPRWWAAPVSVVFLLCAFVMPDVLGPLNRIWTMFGLRLAKITQPIFMAILFYGVFTPFGYLLRLKGTKLLALQRELGAASYWIERTPPGPAPETMKDQY